MPLDGTQYIDPELAEDLAATRRLIINGWSQGKCYEGSSGGMCLYAAIREATHGWDNNPRFLRLHNYVLKRIPNASTSSIPAWNDHPDRTQADVLALLEGI